jgi:flagellar basal-body rod modification protein FlgD
MPGVISAVEAGSSARAGKPSTKTMDMMAPQDFLKLLITQLQSQDPFEPVKNQDLLNQISAIRELQSTMDLSSTLKAMTKQQQIVSAGALIGKTIHGLNPNMENVTGIVTSVTVSGEDVVLELDTGQQVAVKNVTKVMPAAAPAQ